jgi:peptidoglycan/xylan/chitin deacetylase (PgdA/CDA1 family)
MRKIIFTFLYNLRIAHLLLTLNRSNGKIPIALFHRISPDPDPCWPPMTPELFEKTISLLAKHYQFYSLEDILNPKTKKRKNPCCIVFDDGLYDFKLYALPILVKYNVPCTLFVTTNNIENNIPIWTSNIDKIILNAEKSNENKSIFIKKEKVTIKLNSEQNLFNTATHIKNILMSYGQETRDEEIEKLTKYLGNTKGINHPMLSWNDIQDIKLKYADIVNIQSHSHTHPYFPSSQIEEIETESEISLNILKSKNLNSIDKIAYPFGAYDLKTIEIVKKYYSYAFKAGNTQMNLNAIKTEVDWKYKIPRINIHDNSSYEILFRINGFHKLFSR